MIEGDTDDDVTITTEAWNGLTRMGDADIYRSTSTTAVIEIDLDVGIVFL